ncbi:MAG: hypothetical protein JXD23_15020 [Spirochaetales bacterium]|nr:hypothetical protein [Spirochaetales bacterium]
MTTETYFQSKRSFYVRKTFFRVLFVSMLAATIVSCDPHFSVFASVLDESTNLPIENSTVTAIVNHETYVEHTAANGFAGFIWIGRPIDVQITVSKDNYHDQIINIHSDDFISDDYWGIPDVHVTVLLTSL